jgi:hypothetical protein
LARKSDKSLSKLEDFIMEQNNNPTDAEERPHPQVGGPQVGVPKMGGIRAGRIEADNVVQGMQQLGGDLSQAAEAAALAQALNQGDITADSIQAKNAVAGFQYIADPNQATPDELRQEIGRLRQQLAEALAAGEIEAGSDFEDAREALAKAEEELAQPEPQGRRIVRQLKTAAEILTETVQTTEAAQKLGQTVLTLAPAVAALYQIAIKLFGG